jgi:hypothetical protein
LINGIPMPTKIMFARLLVNKWLFLLLFCFFLSPSVQARFFHEDADQVDSESELSTEYFNDEISYRYPFFWERWWRAKRIGARFNAGSYNKTRLMYLQDLKLVSSDERPATFAFRQRRNENLLGQYDEREFEVRLNSLKPVYLSLLGDTDRNKEYGDGGLSVAVMPRKSRSLKFYGWSVDHYYNDKKQDGRDTYEHRIFTYGTAYSWAFSKDWNLNYNFEFDTPLQWNRLSQNYIYEYRRDVHELSTEWGNLNQGLLVRGSVVLEKKHESKISPTDAKEVQEEELARRVQNYELAVNYAKDAKTDLTFGAVAISRDAKYTNSANIGRDELAFHSTYMTQPWQYGLFVNDVKINAEGDRQAKTEVKFQFGWNYTFDVNVAMFANTTWDLDQLVDDFPYEKKDFNPWGGGNLQFIAMF